MFIKFNFDSAAKWDSLLKLEHHGFQMLLLSEPPKDLIRKLLVVDPKKRITIKEALEHPFFQMMVRIITSRAVLCSCGSPKLWSMTNLAVGAMSQRDI